MAKCCNRQGNRLYQKQTSLVRDEVFALKLWCVGLLAGLVGMAGAQGRPQPRMVLQALDLDHDGTLSAAEIAAAPKSLLALDTNGDGMLTADELMERPAKAVATSAELEGQLMAFDKAGKGYLVAADLPERMQAMFTRADANHDGRVTPEELRALSARQGMPVGNVTAPGQASGVFRLDALLNALDLNHDGVISADEIAVASKSLKLLDVNGDGVISPEEMPLRQQTAEERVDHLLEEWDTNKDGRLGKDEAPERMLAQFNVIDANHDGYLDRAELVAWFRAQASGGR